MDVQFKIENQPDDGLRYIHTIFVVCFEHNYSWQITKTKQLVRSDIYLVQLLLISTHYFTHFNRLI